MVKSSEFSQRLELINDREDRTTRQEYFRLKQVSPSSIWERCLITTPTCRFWPAESTMTTATSLEARPMSSSECLTKCRMRQPSCTKILFTRRKWSATSSKLSVTFYYSAKRFLDVKITAQSQSDLKMLYLIRNLYLSDEGKVDHESELKLIRTFRENYDKSQN